MSIKVGSVARCAVKQATGMISTQCLGKCHTQAVMIYLLFRRFVIVILLHYPLLSVASAESGAVSSTVCSATPKQEETLLRDRPAQRDQWFRSVRRSTEAPGVWSKGIAPPPTPAENLRRAFEKLRNARASVTKEVSQPQWKELGPRPQVESIWEDVGGRVTSIAVDVANDPSGNTVYVGTAFGGVWKSINALSSAPQFIPLGDDWMSLSVGSIALDSSTNPPTVFVGTGEANNSIDSYYGVGILKSTKTGWSDPVATARGGYSFAGASVSRILIDPENNKLLFASVSTGTGGDDRKPTLGIYRSDDGGDSWALVLKGGAITDMIYEPGTKTYIAAMRGKGFYRYKVKDAGWTELGLPFQCAIGISESNFFRASLATRTGEIWALITTARGSLSQPFPKDTGLVHSVDGGTTWLPLPVPDDPFQLQGNYDQWIAAPQDSNTLLLGGIDVWRSNDKPQQAQDWINLTNSYTSGMVHPDQHAFYAVTDRKWYVGNDGGLWVSTNRGAGWSNLNATIGAIQFMSVTPDPGAAGRYFGGSQDNGTARNGTTPGPMFWKTTWSGDGGYTASDPTNSLTTYTENYNVSLRRSDYPDGEWNTVVDVRTIDEPGSFYVPYDFLAVREEKLVLGTFRLWRGPAYPVCPGAGWAPISERLTGTADGTIRSLAVAPSNPDVLYVVTDDSFVQKTETATKDTPSWENVTASPLPTDRPFSAIAVHPMNPRIVFLGVSGFGTGHLFKSTNGGSTWTDISSNLLDSPINAILIDDAVPNDIYIANDLGVFSTDDGGSTSSDWQPYGNGLPHSAVLQLKMSSVGERWLLAATHGRGAWRVVPRHSPADFSLGVMPRVQSLRIQSSTQEIEISLLSSGNYNGSVSLSCEAPRPLGCSIHPSTIAPGDSAHLAISGVLNDGINVINVYGKDGKRTRFQTVGIINNSAR